MDEIAKMPMQSKPSMCLNSTDLPEIEEWEVGKEYSLIVRVRAKSKEQREVNGEGSMKTHMDFEIEGVKSDKSPKAYDKSMSKMGEM